MAMRLAVTPPNPSDQHLAVTQASAEDTVLAQRPQFNTTSDAEDKGAEKPGDAGARVGAERGRGRRPRTLGTGQKNAAPPGDQSSARGAPGGVTPFPGAHFAAKCPAV